MIPLLLARLYLCLIPTRRRFSTYAVWVATSPVFAFIKILDMPQISEQRLQAGIWLVITVDAFKIAYMALPKAACSSVKAALALVDPSQSERPLKELNLEAIHNIYKTQRFRAFRFAEYAGWWRFCVVQDPVRRLMSVYSDLVQGRDMLKNSPRLRNGEAGLPVDPGPDFFYANLRPYMRAASVIKHHALPARLFIGSDLSVYDRVFRVSDLDDLAAELSERSGQEVKIPRLNSSRMRLEFSDLKSETQAALWPFLAEEYALLGQYYKSNERRFRA